MGLGNAIAAFVIAIDIACSVNQGRHIVEHRVR